MAEWLLKRGWVLWVALSALITYIGSPPSHLGAVMLVGLVPLFIAFDTSPSWKSAAMRGWIYALLFHSAVAWWSAGAVQEFTHWPWFVGYLVVFTLSAFEHAYWAVIAGLRHVLHKRFGVQPLFWTPIAFMALDAAWPKFFPSTIGNELYSMPVLKQVADITGAWGLTGLLVLVNEAVAMAVQRQWPRPEWRKHLAAALLVLVAALGYGEWRYGQIREQMLHPQRTIRMGLVQPNIGSSVKVISETGDYWTAMNLVLNRFFTLTEQVARGAPELIVWPETAFPGFYHSGDPKLEKPRLIDTLDGFVRELRIPLLTGGYDNEGDNHFNSAFLITPSASRGSVDVQRYHKHYLFGPAERVPLAQSFASARHWLRQHGHGAFSEGEGAKLFDLNGFKLAPAICGEGLYPEYMRRFVDLGAQVFVNLTNDSWFGGGRESEIHLQVMAFRAIETRRPIVRATNTGHTVVVDIDGSFKIETPLDVPRIALVQVPVYPDTLRSPYMVWGDGLLVLGGLWAAAVWFGAWRKFKSSAATVP